MATARIAVDRDHKNKDGNREADWISVVAFRGTAIFFEKYFNKGQKVIVSGRLQVREYQNKNGENRTATEVVANNLYFAGDKEKTPAEPQQDFPPVYENGFTELEDGSDLPF